ncbi:MAG: FAD-dependent oxidoreductase [Candidatus Brocadiales bacterium]
MAKALEGSITIGFKQPELLVSIQEEPVIRYKGSRKKLLEEKKYDVTTALDQSWFPHNIPCRVGCPIGTDARSYSLAISEGKNQLAYLLARQNNPFVSVLGKVCNAPCEPVCQRTRIDSPVSIRALKGFAVEKNRFSTKEVYEWLNTKKLEVNLPQGDRPLRVAIVGGGPAGLSAAHDLALMGYKVKVFEASDRLGGMLNAIPSFKLDSETIKGDVDGILFLGVEVETNKACGKDFSIDELLGQFDAVLLATGLQKGRQPSIPGTGLRGVLDGVDFMKRVVSGANVGLGKDVVVLGGGNAAIDIARTAKRLKGGDIKVSVVCVEAAKGSKPHSPEDEMPADASEIHEAKKEGIIFRTSLAAEEILGEHGMVKGLTVRTVKTVYDRDGRFNPRYKNGRGQVLGADTVILGLGQELDKSFKERDKALELTTEGGLKIDQITMETSKRGVFSCGDMAKPGHIVDAMASGQKAAQSIHQYLGGTGSLGLNGPNEIEPAHYHERHDTFAVRCSIWKSLPPTLPPKKRNGSMALIEGSYSDYEGLRQGQRCLDCSVSPVISPYNPCTLCGDCEESCPAECIHLKFINKADLNGEVEEADGDGPWVSLIIDDTECVHCGACAEACWEDAIYMVKFKEADR